jgi:hypothetical protein
MGSIIFISYRRGADSGVAGRLYDRLERSLGRERVFMDVAGIAPGEDFVTVLKSRIAGCDLLLALIGRGWLAATDTAGQRRLDDPHDMVRIEIGAALAQGKRVIPVVIDDVSMPRAEDLPEDLKALARRQAVRVTHERFADDAEDLVRTLAGAPADAEAAGKAQPQGQRQTEAAEQPPANESFESHTPFRLPPERFRLIAGGTTAAVVLFAIFGLLAWEHAVDENHFLKRELASEQSHEKVLMDLMTERDADQQTPGQRENDDAGGGVTTGTD